MLTLTTTGSTAGRSVVNDRAPTRSGGATVRRGGPAVRESHGLAVLAAVDRLGAQRRLAALAATQFAQHAAAVVDVHPLADKRRAVAAVAVVAAGCERHHTPAQELALQLGCVVSGLRHACSVRRPTDSSFREHRVGRDAVRTRTGTSSFGAEADWVGGVRAAPAARRTSPRLASSSHLLLVLPLPRVGTWR